jgi:hypothetical protein
MSNKKRTKEVQPDEVPTLEIPIDEMVEQPQEPDWSPGERETRYVVIRGGLRVSDKDYPEQGDPRAIAEMNFWRKVISRWPDGTKVEIVQYDKKKHRIW